MMKFDLPWGGRRLGRAVTACTLTVIFVAIAAPAALARTSTGNPAAGKGAFVTTCGTCHMLKAAKTTGMVGPDLDKVKLTQTQITKAIKKGGASVMTKAQLAKYEGVTMPAYASLGSSVINNIAAFVYKSTAERKGQSI
jgi:mono/diheme cytochrome c family protein